MSTVYLNGEFMPLESARVSVLDRGFVFGDGVYEVIPVYAGCLFHAQEHLQRLANSLDLIRLPNPLSTPEWEELCKDLVIRHGKGNQVIYIQVTRGAPEKREHLFPKNTAPTVFVMTSPLNPPATYTGESAITHQDIRWQHCDIKSINLLANVLARQAAAEADAAEALLIREGQLIEGSSSNVFIVENDVIKTPPKSHLILPGITRDVLLGVLTAANIPFEETELTEAQLRTAQEVWIASSTRELMPITKIDGIEVGDGRVGKHWQRAWELYQAHKQAVCQV
jgi:D-alanine transaminase